MRTNRKIAAAIVISMVLFAVGMFACAHQGYGVKAYVAALENLTTLSESYQTSYAAASPEARLKWDEEITPLFIQAEVAMSTWALALDTGADTMNAQRAFLTIRKAILAALIEIEKEE